MQEIAFGVVGGSGVALSQPVTLASPLPITIVSNQAVGPVPSGNANLGIAPTVSSAAALTGTGTLKAGASNLYGINGFASAAGFLLLYDLAAPPADGAITAGLKKVFPIAAAGGFNMEFPYPLKATLGWVWVYSSTAPMTQTTSATAFVSGDAL